MQNYLAESKSIIRLALPVLIAQIAQTSMGVVDTVMAGGVSATDMAAVAVASSVWMPTILFGLGILLALVPIIAQMNGSGKQDKIAYQVQQGVFLALLISVPMIFILHNASVIIDLMDIEEALSVKTIGYLDMVKWAIPGFMLFTVFRGYCEGCSYTTPAMVIGFLGLLANIPLNWIFVYGELGAPALGAVGCAVATLIVYWFMAVALFTYIHLVPKLRQLRPFSNWHRPSYVAIKRLFSLGLPVALSMFFEITLFACIAIFLAPLGSIVVASHQIAVNFSSMVFMIPLSIGTAVSIRVGHAMGRRDSDSAKYASISGISIGLLVSAITALLSVIFRENIALLYNDNPEVIILAGHLMLLAAVYQFSDAVQVIAAGALRGYKDMNAIFIRTFIAYWLIGMPTGYILGRTNWVVEPLGASGFWYGTIIGLSVAALLLGQRLYTLQGRAPEFYEALSKR